MILEKYENPAKFPIGPISPSAGPMLLRQDNAAVILVSMLKLSTDIKSVVNTNSAAYMAK
jgi:hypothetical protein